MKCEWCEERRYTLLSKTYDFLHKDRRSIYVMNLEYENGKSILEVVKQTPPSAMWETVLEKDINYCPFCGKKLNNLGDDDCEL